jgi:hypothetical protein
VVEGGTARWDSWLWVFGFAGFAGDGSVSSWLRAARWVWGGLRGGIRGGSGGGFGWLASSGGAGVCFTRVFFFHFTLHQTL